MYFEDMPNPFKLFTKQDAPIKKENLEEDEKKTNKIPIREGMDNPTRPKKNFALTVIGIIMLTGVFIMIVYSFVPFTQQTEAIMEVLKGTDGESDTRISNILSVPYITLFLVIWMVIFGVIELIYKTEIINTNYSDTNLLYICTLYYVGIVGGTMLFINYIPSLMEIFENTIGMSMIGVMNSSLFVKAMDTIKNRNFNDAYNKNDKERFRLNTDTRFLLAGFSISNLNNQIEFLINQSKSTASPPTDVKSNFYLDNLKDYVSDYNSVITENNGLKTDLLYLILSKYTYGHFTWVYIASIVSILMTINTISINSPQ
jgi:hypothetical protein